MVQELLLLQLVQRSLQVLHQSQSDGATGANVKAGIVSTVPAQNSLITVTSATGDNSSVLFTITGLDMDGNAQTEVIKGATAAVQQ